MCLHFNEIDEGSARGAGWLYTTRALLCEPALSHYEAIRTPLRKDRELPKPPWPEPQGPDLELVRTILCAGSDDIAVLAEVNRLIGAGASLDASFVLHCASSLGRPELVKALVQCAADVNSFGKCCCHDKWRTPLMVADASVHKRNCVHVRPVSDTRCVDALIAFGADRSLVDSRGRTALGVYWDRVRSIDDNLVALHRLSRTGTDTAIETKLRPPCGPTTADKAASVV